MLRLEDCRAELHTLLKEERLAGATLLILANKQDIKGALTDDEIQEVSIYPGILQEIAKKYYLSFSVICIKARNFQACHAAL